MKRCNCASSIQSSSAAADPRLPTFFSKLFKTWIPAYAGMTTLVFVLSGCKVEPLKPPLVETVAVLLFDNESNTLEAPDIMQALVYLALKPSVYKVMDFKEVNDFLNQAGFVDGGQLAIVDPMRLGKDLQVQAVLFGYVENFNYTNIGFYIERKVTVNLKMVDVNTGATIWENSGTGANRKVVLDKGQAGKEFVKGVADQYVDKLFNTPLESEAKLATVNALRTLPGFRFTCFAQDENTLKGVKKVGKGILKDIIRNK